VPLIWRGGGMRWDATGTKAWTMALQKQGAGKQGRALPGPAGSPSFKQEPSETHLQIQVSKGSAFGGV